MGDPKHQFNLPLLFANGCLTSLESLNLAQLQKFLLFLLSCEKGHEVHSLKGLKQPKWWPIEAEFNDSILEKTSKKGLWSCLLRRTIQKCYNYHNAESLLYFSRQLQTLTEGQGASNFQIVDNGDGTRSMRSVSSQKILVTFKSENQDYDRQTRIRPASVSTLSPMKGVSLLATTKNNNNTSDPTLPRCSDVYLCDICGADFESLPDVLAHERQCKIPTIEKEAEPDFSQHHFFTCLNLQPIEPGPDQSRLSTSSMTEPSAMALYKPVTYDKFLSIAVTSPLGRYINKLVQGRAAGVNGQASTSACSKKGHRYAASSQGRRASSRVANFRVTFRGPKDKRRQSPHMYCFNKEQLAIRLQTIRTGLSSESLALMRTLSKRPCQILLERLSFQIPMTPTREEIQMYVQSAKAKEATASSHSKQFNDDNLNVVVLPKIVWSSGNGSHSSSNTSIPKAKSTKLKIFNANGDFSPGAFYQNFMYSGQLQQPRLTGLSSAVAEPLNDVPVVDLCSTDEEEPISDSTFSSSSDVDIDDDEDVVLNYQTNIPVQHLI